MKRNFLLIGLVLLLASLIIGCPAPVVEEPVADEPVVEEPVVEEPLIPAHFTTHTDEANLFSISYPADWELDPMWAGEDEQFTKEVIESIEFDLPLERSDIMFMAGLPAEIIYEPYVKIVVGPLPGVGWTLDEVVEADLQAAKDFLGEDYHEFSRVKTTIGGREAVIVDWEMTLRFNQEVIGKMRSLTMTTLVGETVWTVTCTPEEGKFDQSEDDFYAIVRSLRILK